MGKIGSKRLMALAAIGCLLIGVAWYYQRSAQHTLYGQLLADARASLGAGKYADAEALARRLLVAGSAERESRLLAAEAAAAQGASDRALAYLEPLLEGSDKTTVTALGAAANIAWDQGQISAAEQHLRRLLQIAPDNDYATSKLAYLLTLTGRHWESGPLRLALMRRDSFQFEDLLLWGNARALVQTDELARLRQLAPEDPLLMLGEASVAARSNDLKSVRKLLPAIIAAQPDLIEARVLQGNLLLEGAGLSDEEMQKWSHNLPDGSDEHPDVWVIRGLWTIRSGASQAAGRCFWEAVRRSPNHHTGNYQLALVLGELGSPDSNWFRERATSLEELQRMLGVLDTQRGDIATMRRVVELHEKLGRAWEAWGWSRVALLVDPSLKWAQEARDRAAAQAKSSPPQVLPGHDPASKFDYSAWPLPEWMSKTESADNAK
jgi:tetratricopeptide (TPR) repeat protein